MKLKTSVWDSELNREHVTLPRKAVTLTDRVEYQGLEKGEKYTIEGVLMDKSTGRELLVNGRKVTSTKEFTAEAENGKIDVEFTFDASAFEDCRIVVFETLVKGGLVIARHEDINDTDQTIRFLRPETGSAVSTGDRIPAAMLPALTLMTVSAVIAVAVLYRRKHTQM